MKRLRHRLAPPRPSNMYDQLLLLLLIAKHADELGIMKYLQACLDLPPLVAFDMDCKEVRQAIAEGEDTEQYRKAIDLYVRTGSTELLRNLRGVKVAELLRPDIRAG
jgi:hypothetical protein